MMRMGLVIGALLAVTSARAEVVISEFMAANRETLRDARGEASDWIELHNRGDAAVDLAGWHLTDDPGDPTQWTFPAVTLPPDGFLLVFASGKAGTIGDELHTGFRLSQNGEYLGLIKPDGVTVAHAYAPAFPRQTPDISYGLPPGAPPDAPVYFKDPTPGGPNASRPFTQTAAPLFDPPGGLQDAPLRLTLDSADTRTQIRYTLDGSWPTERTGQLYTGALDVAANAIVRARGFTPGAAPSGVVTHSYLFPETPIVGPRAMAARAPRSAAVGDAHADALRALPTLALVTDPAHLYDPATGLLRNLEGSGADWEREASLEWFNGGEHRPEFRESCALRLYGNTSRRLAKPTWRILFKEGYGPTKLARRVFREADATTRFDTLILRGGNQDAMTIGGLADEFMRRTQREAGMPAAHGTFAHLYLNGRYQGIYNVTERPGGRRLHFRSDDNYTSA